MSDIIIGAQAQARIAELEAELQAERSDNAAANRKANRKAEAFREQLAEARKDTDRLDWLFDNINIREPILNGRWKNYNDRSDVDRAIDAEKGADHAE